MSTKSRIRILHLSKLLVYRMSFNGKYALITGAAAGMGRIYALKLSGMGYGIIAADINRNGLDSLAGELTSVPFVPVCIDLTSKDAAQRLASMAEAEDVEILVNNAGMLVTRNIADTPAEKLEAMMALHCTTPLLICHAFVPKMQAAGKGYILNISSICAWMDWPVIGMYGNTKRFVKGYSRSLRIECAGTGVSVTTAVFGAVDTPLFGFPPKTTERMLKWGVMISPHKAVDKALDAMFKKKKKTVPGIVNRIIIPLVSILPDGLLERLLKKYGHLVIR